MNFISLLISLLMIISLVSADPLLTTIGYVDIKGLSTLKRVTKLQKLTIPYVLSGSNIWSEYPGLGINFHLPTDQYVHISYSTVVPSNNQCHLITRLMINKVENILFRDISEYTYYHSNKEAKSVWLEKGNYFINVDYRSPCSWSLVPLADWNIAYIMVEYFDA